jgi:hypothetical protein
MPPISLCIDFCILSTLPSEKRHLLALLIDAWRSGSPGPDQRRCAQRLLKELQGKGIAVYVADMHVRVREFAQRTELLELIGEDHIFPTVDAAVRFLETDAG